ncbi:DNA-binding protein Alba [Candidatus Bathyarchaeota archaeon]|nr:DNA-binding protein Alba [Candidatus Bathyarchaeota archaeon]
MPEGETKREQAEKPTKEAPEKRPKRAPERKEVDRNTVYIGSKPVMNYVVACLTFFNSGVKKVVLKARGRAISRAVDTAELLRRVFVKDAQVQSISIGTEQVARVEGETRNVSTIELTISKP